jgi:hypothetical protein
LAGFAAWHVHSFSSCQEASKHPLTLLVASSSNVAFLLSRVMSSLAPSSWPVTYRHACSRKLGLFPDGVVVYQVTSVAVGSFSGIDVAKRPEKGITEETSVAGLQARTAYSHSMIEIATILTARLSHAIFQCTGCQDICWALPA